MLCISLGIAFNIPFVCNMISGTAMHQMYIQSCQLPTHFKTSCSLCCSHQTHLFSQSCRNLCKQKKSSLWSAFWANGCSYWFPFFPHCFVQYEMKENNVNELSKSNQCTYYTKVIFFGDNCWNCRLNLPKSTELSAVFLINKLW